MGILDKLLEANEELSSDSELIDPPDWLLLKLC